MLLLAASADHCQESASDLSKSSWNSGKLLRIDSDLTSICGWPAYPLTGGYVKHMYSNILCVQKQILHTRSLLSGCSAGRHSFSTLLPVPNALLCYAEYAQVAERDPHLKSSVRRRGRKISKLLFFYFFQLMKQMFGIPPSTALL